MTRGAATFASTTSPGNPPRRHPAPDSSGASRLTAPASLPRVMRRALALFLLLGSIAAGCGGDDSTDGSGGGGGSDPTSEAAANPGGTLTPSDGEEIVDVLRTWTLEGGCEYMTDSFLEDQTFIDDPAEACEVHESTHEEPAYSADDVIVTDIKGTGDRASAVISDDFSNVETTFQLRKEDGAWKIDSADIN